MSHERLSYNLSVIIEVIEFNLYNIGRIVEEYCMRTLARFVTSSYKYIIFAWIAIFIVMAIFAIRLPRNA